MLPNKISVESCSRGTFRVANNVDESIYMANKVWNVSSKPILHEIIIPMENENYPFLILKLDKYLRKKKNFFKGDSDFFQFYSK